MTRRVLYVSGPVTGMPDDNREAFEAAADELAACGYIARIPHWDVRPGEKWPAAMRTTLMAILATASRCSTDGSAARARSLRPTWPAAS